MSDDKRTAVLETAEKAQPTVPAAATAAAPAHAPIETVAPKPEEPKLFEAELELEKKTSNWVPMLLLLALIAGMIGTLVYFIVRARVQVTPDQAAPVMSADLKARKPPVAEFRTGVTWYTETWGTSGAQYRLLQRAGVLRVESRQHGEKVEISLTPKGEQMLSQTPGVKKEKQSEMTAYTVPLASRVLVKVDRVTMINPDLARVEYTWKWVPNQFGDIFDSDGTLMKKMDVYERGYLIQNAGANTYHGAVRKDAVDIAHNDKGWSVAID